jgi:hypothetical protein
MIATIAPRMTAIHYFPCERLCCDGGHHATAAYRHEPDLVKADPPTAIEVNHVLVVRLRPEAPRHDVPVVRLINDLLDTIVRDGLTAAVLDADTVPDDGDHSSLQPWQPHLRHGPMH